MLHRSGRSEEDSQENCARCKVSEATSKESREVTDPTLIEEVQRAQRKLKQRRRQLGYKDAPAEIPPVPVPECAKPPAKESDPNDEKIQKRIEEAFQIQEQEAKEAGKLGYIGRVHTQATIPHSNQDPVTEYERENGNFHLYVKAPHSIGLPYGTLPRLLFIWMSTEVVFTAEPRLDLGKNMSRFFERINLPITGGKRGYIRPMREQMIRLFNCDIRYRYGGPECDQTTLFAVQDYKVWWLKPEQRHQDDLFPSYVLLTNRFFEDLFNHAVPIDLRAIAFLRKSPLALDLYCWLTHRFSYLRKRTEIPWEALAVQFGSNYKDVASFKFKVKKALKDVKKAYPEANIDPDSGKYGLILKRSPTHIRKSIRLVTSSTGDRVDLPTKETAEKWVARHHFSWTKFLQELGHVNEMSVGAHLGREEEEAAAQKRVEVAARRADVPVGIAFVLAGLTLNR